MCCLQLKEVQEEDSAINASADNSRVKQKLVNNEKEISDIITSSNTETEDSTSENVGDK